MQKHQVEPNKNGDSPTFPHVQQSETASEMVPKKIIRALGWLLRSLYAEIKSLRSLIKELEEELLKKDLSISFLKRDREILIDENEWHEKKLENYIAEHWEYFKRKIILL